jgi:hypothetical protein
MSVEEANPTPPAAAAVDLISLRFNRDGLVRASLSECLEETELSAVAFLPGLIDALSHNTTVKEFVLDHRGFVEELSRENLLELMHSVGSLPCLENLSIQFLGQPGDPLAIPVDALTTALRASASRLLYLEVTWARLEGNSTCFQDLFQVLQHQCHSLTVVKLRNLGLDPSEDMLEQLLASVSYLPNMEELFLLDAHRILNDQKMSETIGSTALQRLCRLDSLKTLCLMFPLSEHQVTEIACSLADKHATLERLALFRCNVSSRGCVALAGMLHTNDTLQILRLDDNVIDDEGCLALAHALLHNSSLRILDLKGNDTIGNQGYEALCHVLQHDNFSIMALETDSPAEQKDRIGFYLRLNEHARKSFLRSIHHRQLFVGCLSTFKDDLDILYYYVQANPSICLD